MNLEKLTLSVAIMLCTVQTAFGTGRAINPVKQTFRGIYGTQYTVEGQVPNSIENLDITDITEIQNVLKKLTRKDLGHVLHNLERDIAKYTTKNLKSIFFNLQQHNYNTSKFIHVVLEDMGNDIDRYSSQEAVLFFLGRMYNGASAQNKDAIMDFIVNHLDTDDFLKLPWKHSVEELFSKEDVQKINTALIKKLDPLYDTSTITCQSTGHLERNALRAKNLIQEIKNNEDAKSIFSQVLQHERAIADKAAVFYHSQQNPVYWLEILYTKLWERKYNQKNNNYIFTRFPDDCSSWSNAILQYDGHQNRKKILTNGVAEDWRYVLFVNYALFGNSTDWGSCSAHSFIDDWKIPNPSITSQMILDKFGNQKLYDTYKEEIEQLEHEFKTIIPNKVLLQLILPYEALQDHVYLAAPCGFKKKLKIRGKETDNVSTILYTLKTAPDTIDDSDRQEFCIVMTPDTVHTLREQGAEIRVYGTHDKEKLNQLIAKLEALIDKIATENPEYFSPQLTPTQSYEAYKDVIKALTK